MAVRDHKGIILDKFNGLWDRGDKDSTPIDHFTDANNIKHIASTAFGTRDGIGISQDVAAPLQNVKRIYNYPTATGNTLLVLVGDTVNITTFTPEVLSGLFNLVGNTRFDPIVLDPTNNSELRRLEKEIYSDEDDDTSLDAIAASSQDVETGQIFHVINATTVYGPILTIQGMIDFGFVPYDGRAYITPFGTFVTGDLNIEKGLSGEFLYVYLGNGTVARKAAGNAITGSITIANGAAGNTDAGFHLFAIIEESDTGYLSAPGAITGFTTGAAQSVSFGNIPTTGSPSVVKRHLVATKVIATYNGNTTGYTFYFVPNATINNNTDTFLNNISFFDADLLDDASHLIDNYSEIPAGVGLSLYHNRLVIYTSYNDINMCLVSAVGEPEAISQIDGLIVFPPDGNPITNAQELRDVLYVFKRTRTVAFVDSGDVPSSWPMTFIDNGLGTCVHGIATVLDSGSASVDALIIANYQGVSLFNGAFIVPELSWKIENLWRSFERNDFRLIQIVNAVIQKEIYITMPDRTMLAGNYSNGMNAKNIRWEPWTFLMGVNTVAIVNIDEIVLGADLVTL